jgi:hypothetical protein
VIDQDLRVVAGNVGIVDHEIAVRVTADAEGAASSRMELAGSRARWNPNLQQCTIGAASGPGSLGRDACPVAQSGRAQRVGVR